MNGVELTSAVALVDVPPPDDQAEVMGAARAGDERVTPQWLFDALDAEFHFGLDAAASHSNAKCRRYFTAAEDGLKRAWFNFPCDCLHAVQARVAGDEPVLLTKASEEERTVLLVQGVSPGVGQDSDGRPAPLGSPESEGDESAPQDDRALAGQEACRGTDRQQPQKGASPSVQVVDGGLEQLSGCVGPQVRVLPIQRQTRTRSRDSVVGPILPGDGALEHRASVPKVQSRGTQQQEGVHCPGCGLSGQPATVFVNPPYSRGSIPRWCEKAEAEAGHGVTTALLLPADTSTHYFHRYVLRHERRFLNRRLTFDGAPRDRHGRLGPAKFGSVIVIVRPSHRYWTWG